MATGSADLVHVAGSTELAAELAASTERARAYAHDARSPKTRSTYAGELKQFGAWCAARELAPLPAEDTTVALYLASLADAGRAAAGIELALTAISQAHRLAGFASPRGSREVSEVRKGIRRTLGIAQRAKAPLLPDALRAVVAALPSTPIGVRDRALLLLGWAGAFRRGELVALDVEDLHEVPEGLRVTIRRSKTDQMGRGQEIGVPRGTTPATCPVQAVLAWIDASTRTSGALFVGLSKRAGLRLAGGDVARILKRAAAAAGIDPRELAGHSLRRGLATAAARAKKNAKSIQGQLRHRSPAMTARYIEAAGLFEDNAAAGLL